MQCNNSNSISTNNSNDDGNGNLNDSSKCDSHTDLNDHYSVELNDIKLRLLFGMGLLQ